MIKFVLYVVMQDIEKKKCFLYCSVAKVKQNLRSYISNDTFWDFGTKMI